LVCTNYVNNSKRIKADDNNSFVWRMETHGNVAIFELVGAFGRLLIS